MDSGKLLELAIIAIILAGIGYVIWRGGAANPVGTGAVQHKVNNFGHEMKALGSKLSSFGEQISQLQANSASAEDVRRIEAELRAQEEKTEQFAGALLKVDEELQAMRRDRALSNQAIEALSRSLRSLSAELKEHRDDVAEKLATLPALREQVEGNRRAIDNIVTQLPGIREKQDGMAREVSAAVSDLKIIGRQIDRLYDVLIPKGLDK
ncbi:hypothetical protein A3718_00870 [Erythrobacter sp. HI0019]|uniref:hypothetical protein n=1 Tax=unclassified Erythrobacter TaxID=2633097 RepID=UPI0007B7D7A7|nr:MULTISPECIES: hypothetical protein [unclassified Erythrobacter]KZX94637.1 hypothetical protein A3718_00870 [Erythrobacter sp. HI0019]KZY08829.1 hypothetical protein A3723_11770 [Erythrobacter sp. HI0028]